MIVLGKLLSGEEEGLEDDPERAEVTTGSFTGKLRRGVLLCFRRSPTDKKNPRRKKKKNPISVF